MVAVTICSNFGARENNLSPFPLFPHLFAMKWWDLMSWSLFFEWTKLEHLNIWTFEHLNEWSLNIWKFMVHVLLNPGLKNFEHYFASVWNERNCVVVWAFFGIAFLCDGNEKWPFLALWPFLSFPNLLAYWLKHFNSIIF